MMRLGSLLAPLLLLLVAFAPAAAATGGHGEPCRIFISSWTATDAAGNESTFMNLHGSYDRGDLAQGDALRLAFTLGEGCKDATISLVTYRTSGPDFSTSFPQTLHDSDTRKLGHGTHTLGPVDVPDCFFQVDLVWGEPIHDLRPDNLYGDRKISWENGGHSRCDAPASPTPTPTPPAPTPTPPTPPANHECPTDLTARANDDKTVTLRWTGASGAEYRVYRSTDGGPFTLMATPSGTTWSDLGTEGGVTYAYKVSAVAGGVESKGCSVVEVTAIPFFPGLVVGALALVGGVGGFVLLRRRG